MFQRSDQAVVVPVPLVDGSVNFRTAQQVQDYDSFAVLIGNPRVPPSFASNGSYKLTLGLKTVPTTRSSVGRFKGRFRSDTGG